MTNRTLINERNIKRANLILKSNYTQQDYSCRFLLIAIGTVNAFSESGLQCVGGAWDQRSPLCLLNDRLCVGVWFTRGAVAQHKGLVLSAHVYQSNALSGLALLFSQRVRDHWSHLTFYQSTKGH